jgi:tetratricopeptide (TPR) repeat protein
MNAAVRLAWVAGFLWLGCGLGLQGAHSDQLLAAFDQANRLYEQGQFAQAAAAYQQLIDAGHQAATLYYNLGNAWFKAGQLGRAIAAYRQAEQLAPRDPYIRFNLRFARNKVSGRPPPTPSVSQRALQALSLDEWAILAMTAWWLWLGLLCVRELRPDWRRALRGYALAGGAGALLLVLLLGLAVHQQRALRMAVVVVPNAAVRTLPWEGKESQVCAHLPDGAEVQVLDQRQLSPTERWLQVAEANRPLGWIRADQVVLLHTPATGPERRLGAPDRNTPS